MRSAKSKIIFLFFAALFTGFVISACNSNPPVVEPNMITGTLPTFTPTPCNGLFGTNVIEPTLSTLNDVWFDRYSVSASKSLISISAYTISASPVTYELGIYADNGTGANPTTLIAETGPVTIGPATIWNTVPLTTPVNISAFTYYWLAMHASVAYYVSGGTIPYAYQPTGAFGTLPGTFTGTSSGTFISFSLYGTTCP